MNQLDDARALLIEAERADQLAATELVERLALLGTFDPAGLDGADAEDVVALLCQQLPSRDVILGERRRIDALARMLARGGREELQRRRREVPPHGDTPLQRM